MHENCLKSLLRPCTLTRQILHCNINAVSNHGLYLYRFRAPYHSDSKYYQITAQYPNYDDKDFREHLLPGNCGNISLEVRDVDKYYLLL